MVVSVVETQDFASLQTEILRLIVELSSKVSIFQSKPFTPLLFTIANGCVLELDGCFFRSMRSRSKNILAMSGFRHSFPCGDQNERADTAKGDVRDGHHAVGFAGVEHFVQGGVRIDFFEKIEKRIEFVDLNVGAQMLAQCVEQRLTSGRFSIVPSEKAFERAASR